MATQLVVCLVVETLDGSIFDRAVHSLDLAVGPWMFGFGQAMIDVVESAGDIEGMSPEWLLPLDHGFDISHAPTLATWIGEVGAVVRQNGVDLVRGCFDQVLQKGGGDTSCRLLVQLGEG